MAAIHEKGRADFNLARLKVGKEKFEVVVNPEKAMAYKQNRSMDIRDVLFSEKVFSDAQKGLAASEHLMQQIFETSDPLEVAKQIIERGEIQLTTEYRALQREEKRKKVIDIIHKNAIDPTTNLPHPPKRIELALEEAKVKIDEHKKAEDQIQEILKKLRPILPIRFEVRQIEVKIAPEFAAKSYPILKNFGRLVNDNWQNDGSLLAVVEVPAGLQQDFFSEINRLTKGKCETRVLGAK